MTKTLLAGLLGGLCLLPVSAPFAQEPERVEESVATIDAEFQRAFRDLERQRITRLARLADRQTGPEAVATYLVLFQDALTTGHFAEAEPIAERILQQGQSPTQLRYLAHLTNILAEVDRSDFEESLKSLKAAIIDARPKADGADDDPQLDSLLPEATRLSLIETYYQRLVQASQYDIARRAFSLLQDQVQDPQIREYVKGRLERIDMVGKPAPAITGQDIDGKDFRLDELKGQVVLIDFWATWCLPSAVEAEQFGKLLNRYQEQGLRIVGINLDPLDQGASRDPDDHMPVVRRFLIEHNIRWPNLLNIPDAQDFARIYGVTDIPANFLVGPNGEIVAIDLLGGSLEAAIQKALESR